jgi:hypothetical protein
VSEQPFCDEHLQGDVSAEALSGRPGIGFLVGGPGEVDYREAAVVDVECHAVASGAGGDGGQAVVGEFVARSDLGERFAFEGGGLLGGGPIPGMDASSSPKG